MAEFRPEEPSERAKSCREDLWNEMKLEGDTETETDTRTE